MGAVLSSMMSLFFFFFVLSLFFRSSCHVSLFFSFFPHFRSNTQDWSCPFFFFLLLFLPCLGVERQACEAFTVAARGFRKIRKRKERRELKRESEKGEHRDAFGCVDYNENKYRVRLH